MNDDIWNSHATRERILGRNGPFPVSWDTLRPATARIQASMANRRKEFISPRLSDGSHHVEWIYSGIGARENMLLLGLPGGGKSELVNRIGQAARIARIQGERDYEQLEEGAPEGKPGEHDPTALEWWTNRYVEESKRPKLFYYQFNRFTQPEEVFGPLDIFRLKRGISVRVNWSMLTAPATYLASLDELFKGGTGVLNTLLMILQERAYLNWGKLWPSDLVSAIATSNEMPGGFGMASEGANGTESFSGVWALVDRFPLRLRVPALSGKRDVDGGIPADCASSQLGKAFGAAVQREQRTLAEGRSGRFVTDPVNEASLNDLLLVGRALLHDRHGDGDFFSGRLEFEELFLKQAAWLAEESTAPEAGRVTWTISPRKLNALYKIALAHALLTHPPGTQVPLGKKHLGILFHIWDSEEARLLLDERIGNELA